MVHNELHAIDLGIIAAYLIAMVAIGVVVVKKVPRLLIPLLLSLQAVYDEYLLELHGARDGLDEAPNNERINAKGYI